MISIAKKPYDFDKTNPHEKTYNSLSVCKKCKPSSMKNFIKIFDQIDQENMKKFFIKTSNKLPDNDGIDFDRLRSSKSKKNENFVKFEK